MNLNLIILYVLCLMILAVAGYGFYKNIKQPPAT